MWRVTALGLATLIVAGAAAAQPASTQAPAASEERPEPGPAARFIRDVGSDYRQFVSQETAAWLGVASSAALAIRPADEAIRQDFQDASGSPDFKWGQQYGNLSVQVPLAMGWWMAGHVAGSQRASAAGRDLLRAQISAVSWTYALKYPVNRTRPNGDSRSFPSGHASATFATAAVLRRHYGWKAGAPAYVLATYTAMSRVADNKHWTSDAVFGAFLGVASGRVVTIRLRGGRRLALAAWPTPGGAGVLVTAR